MLVFFVTKWKENDYIKIFIDLWLCDATADAKIMRRKMNKISLSTGSVGITKSSLLYHTVLC